MNWENILKRPMPLDTDTQRDTDYRQEIVSFEKTHIEPKAEAYVRGLPAGTPVSIFISVDPNAESSRGTSYDKKPMQTKKNKDGLSFGYFNIGAEGVKRLGQDRDFIKNTIADIYRQEGFKVEVVPLGVLITKGE